MSFKDGAEVRDVAAAGMQTICKAVYPSPSCRCQLPDGHEGPHRVIREDLEVEWDDGDCQPLSLH